MRLRTKDNQNRTFGYKLNNNKTRKTTEDESTKDNMRDE